MKKELKERDAEIIEYSIKSIHTMALGYEEGERSFLERMSFNYRPPFNTSVVLGAMKGDIYIWTKEPKIRNIILMSEIPVQPITVDGKKFLVIKRRPKSKYYYDVNKVKEEIKKVLKSELQKYHSFLDFDKMFFLP